ncbi:TetR/AcrR family transcriptional regulator [Mycolicibacterium thermoresistibile]
MPADWLAGRRTEVAAERILDAVEDLFTRRDAATVGMLDIARAAGCSRATLYRYFDSREALYTAYVHREARRLYRQLGPRLTEISDPRDRLVEGIVAALRSVRENPALASWFASGQRPIGAELAGRSEVIHSLVESFLRAQGYGADERRARWLVRIILSLLLFPGRDEDDERALLEDFVVPTVASTPAATGGQATQ